MQDNKIDSAEMNKQQAKPEKTGPIEYVREKLGNAAEALHDQQERFENKAKQVLGMDKPVQHRPNTVSEEEWNNGGNF